MKKILILAMICMMVLALGACGGDKGGAKDKGGDSYDLDYTSTEVQPMSEARSSIETLEKAKKEWLENLNYFPGTEQTKLTYADFVDYIGCDASEYHYDKDYKRQVYTWYSEVAGENIQIRLDAYFLEDGGVWKLNAAGYDY